MCAESKLGGAHSRSACMAWLGGMVMDMPPHLVSNRLKKELLWMVPHIVDASIENAIE